MIQPEYDLYHRLDGTVTMAEYDFSGLNLEVNIAYTDIPEV